jgi:hypothetical protein
MQKAVDINKQKSAAAAESPEGILNVPSSWPLRSLPQRTEFGIAFGRGLLIVYLKVYAKATSTNKPNP